MGLYFLLLHFISEYDMHHVIKLPGLCVFIYLLLMLYATDMLNVSRCILRYLAAHIITELHTVHTSQTVISRYICINVVKILNLSFVLNGWILKTCHEYVKKWKTNNFFLPNYLVVASCHKTILCSLQCHQYMYSSVMWILSGFS
jgi:hypothetical protein